MHAVLYRPISEAAPTWAENKITDIFKIISYSYTKKFYEVGGFSIVIPVNEPSTELLEINTFLAVDNSDFLFVTGIKETESRITLEGYDLKYLLAGRITLFPTEEQDTGTYGYYVTKGSTGECICNIVRHNITEASDPNRRIYGFSVSNSAQGLAEDTYMTRLEPLDQVVATLCKNAGIGYDVTMEIGSSFGDGIKFEVIKGTDRSEKQTDVPKVIFAKSFLNVESLSREVGVDAEKNAIYAINGTNIDDAVVKLVNRDGEDKADYGVYRRETTVNVNCDVDEIDSYALKEAEDFISTDSFIIEAAAAESYKKEWFVGDIVTFRHKEITRHVPIIAAEIQRTAEKFTVKLSAGESPLKPVSRVNRTANKVADEITQKKFDDGYVLVVKELPEEGKENKIYVLEAENSEVALLADDTETEETEEAKVIDGYVFVEGEWKKIGGGGGKENNAEKIKFIRDNVEYGAVGIHEVDGETSIALSITGASNRLALLDENGEKILEYIPNKREDGKPYEVKNVLWFYPVKSQNVHDFEGFYFCYPYFETGQWFDPAEVDEKSPFYNIVNSTIFCMGGEEYVQTIRAAGFPQAVNAQSYNNDVWEINGKSYGISVETIPYGMTMAGFVIVLKKGNTEFFRICIGRSDITGLMLFPLIQAQYDDSGAITGVSIAYYGLEKNNADGKYMLVTVTQRSYTLPSEVYDDLLKDIVEAAAQSDEIPKNTVRIYKDIFLMNGAKILNEDGTAI